MGRSGSNSTRKDEIFKLVTANDATYIPYCTLGGIEITAPEGFVWMFTSGVEPFTTMYVDYDKNINAIYEKAGGGDADYAISFTYKIYMLSSSGISYFEGEIPNLHVLQRRIERRQGLSSLVITDERYFMQNIQYPASFNCKRRMPRNKIFDNIAEKLQDTYALPTYMYYPETLNNGKPYSAFEIADEFLKKFLTNYGGHKRKKLDGPRPDDQDITGVKITDIISANLLRARMQLGMFPDGKFYTYPVDDHDNFLSYLAEAGLTIPEKEKHVNPTSGALFVNDLFRQRARKVNVGFQKVYEIAAEFNTEYDTSEIEASYLDEEPDYINPHNDGEYPPPPPNEFNYPRIPKFANIYNKLDLSPKMLNVAPAPFKMLIQGREIAPGTYLPVKFYLEEWDIDENDILDYWFGHNWTTRVLIAEFKKTGRSDSVIESTPEYRAKINLIMQHWTQTFQIDPHYMSGVETISANRAIITDYISGTMPPSEVRTNYTSFPNMYPPIGFYKQYGIDTNDLKMGQPIIHAPMEAEVEEVLKKPVSDYTVQVIDKKAGIIHVMPITDAHGVNYQLVPRDAYPDTIPAVPKQADPLCFTRTRLNKQWRIVIILSASFIVPNSKSRMHWESINIAQQFSAKQPDGGIAQKDLIKTNENVVYEKISRAVTARHEIDTESGEKVNLSVTKKPTNQYQLKAVAISEAVKYYHQMKNRIDGNETYNGIYKIPLFANIGSISYNFSINGVTTHISADQIPPSKDAMDELPTDLGNLLRGWLSTNK